jgi:hypothetical protein
MPFGVEVARAEAIRACLESMRAVFEPGARVRYASTAITTGPLMYQTFRENNVRSREEFEAKGLSTFELIIKPNIEAGVVFGNKLREIHRYVISPAEFNAEGWLQGHYMSFWRHAMHEFVTDSQMKDG